MSDGPQTYVQRLPAIGLAIERATDRTPDARRYHLYRRDELLGSFTKLADAQARFREARDESGWTAPERKADPSEALAREKEAGERYRQAEHWQRVSSRKGWFKGHRV